MTTPDPTLASTDVPLFVSASVPAARPLLPADFGPGSPVVVLEPSYRRLKDHTDRPGVVKTRARVWVTVTMEGCWPNEMRFRLDDQTDGGQSNYRWRFCTSEQRTWDEVQAAASSYLHAQGLIPELRSPWRDRIVELARAVWRLNHPDYPEEVRGVDVT